MWRHLVRIKALDRVFWYLYAHVGIVEYTALRFDMSAGTEECPFVCSECGAFYKSRRWLKDHFLKNHPTLTFADDLLTDAAKQADKSARLRDVCFWFFFNCVS